MEEKVTPEELDKYFSNVSYDYYNLPMAIIFSFYKHKFAPMTFDQLLNDITSKNDSIYLLRKANRQKYTSIKIDMNRILNEKTKLFKTIKNNKKINIQTYEIILDEVIDFWKYQVKSMNNINKSSIKKLKNSKKYYEDRIKKEKENDEINSKNNELLSKKTKRKINRTESTPIKTIAKNNDDLDGYKTSRKKEIDDKKDKDSEIKGYSTDISINLNNIKNNEASLIGIFDNTIYNKMPEIDEENLNNIIKKFGKLIEKLDKINQKLKALQTSKYVIKFFNEYKKLSENEKSKILNIYENIQVLMDKKKLNIDSIGKFNEQLKNSIDYYLDIYGCSYESLFKILCEKNEILDYLWLDKEKEINNDMKDCFQKLYNFITVKKKQIKESNNFLKTYTRNYYKARFYKVLKKLGIDIPHNEKTIDISMDHSDNNNKSEKEVNKIKSKSINKSKDRKNKRLKNDFAIKNAIIEEHILSDNILSRNKEYTSLKDKSVLKKTNDEKKKKMNIEDKKDDNNKTTKKTDNKKNKNNKLKNSDNIIFTNNRLDDNKENKNNNSIFNKNNIEKNLDNSEFIYAFEELKSKKFKDKTLSIDDDSFISYSEIKSDEKKSYDDEEIEKNDDSKKSQITATFLSTLTNASQKNINK
jgi:hypothetical protein